MRGREHHRDNDARLETIDSELSLIVSKSRRSANWHEQDIHRANIEGFGRAHGVFDSALVTKPNAIHGPDIGHVHFRGGGEGFRTGAHSSDKNPIGSIHTGGHRAANNHR